MVKYFCDVCGAECNGTLFSIPRKENVGTHYHPTGGKILFEYKPEEKMLCDSCCEKIINSLNGFNDLISVLSKKLINM